MMRMYVYTFMSSYLNYFIWLGEKCTPGVFATFLNMLM